MDHPAMKSGFLDLLLETCGWVVGKTFLFFFGVALGMAMAVISILMGGWVSRSSAQASVEVLSLAFWGAVVIQFGAVFIAALWWVHSEKAGIKSWRIIVTAIAIDLVAVYGHVASAGLFARIVMWIVIAAFLAGFFRLLQKFSAWQQRRFEANAARLEKENAERRVVLQERFGTVSAGARDLGIAE